MVKLSIILPCFNEELNIKNSFAELIQELEKLSITYEIIAVDDGSNDNTLRELLDFQKKCHAVKVVRHSNNMGLGAAIKTGIEKASGELTITLDADLTFHPNQIKNLFERFNRGDVDCIIGNPKIMGYSNDISFYRIAISRIGSMIYNLILPQKISAITPIFRIYKTAQLKELSLETNGFGINAEILAKMLIKKRKIVEIPAKLTKRIYGESKMNNLREILRQLILVIKILYWRFSDFYNKRK